MQWRCRPTHFRSPTTITKISTLTISECNTYLQSMSISHINDFLTATLNLRQRRLHITIITDGPNKLWTSVSTMAPAVRKSGKATKIVDSCYGRDDITIRGCHLQRLHFQETNWRIWSIDEIWIILDFNFKAGTHSPALSWYISLPAELLLSIGSHWYRQSSWRYGTGSQ